MLTKFCYNYIFNSMDKKKGTAEWLVGFQPAEKLGLILKILLYIKKINIFSSISS